MKRLHIIALALCAISLPAQAGIEIKNLGGASLPRESEDLPAFQGQSWPAASANWMTALRTNVNAVGSGRDLALREHDLGDYHKILTTTAVRTWQGMDDTSGPTVEYGNFWHQGVQIVATDGSTFIPSQVTVRVQSLARNISGDLVLGSFDRITTFTNLNYFRQVLNPDGSVAGVQNSSLPTTNFVYGGIGVALTMGGSGTTQQKLDATANNWWNKDYTLRYTVTVPQGEGSVTKTWDVKRKPPTTVVSGTKIVLGDTFVGKLYKIWHSPTLGNDWQVLQTVSGTGAPIEITMPHVSDTTTYPKMFYRVEF